MITARKHLWWEAGSPDEIHSRQATLLHRLLKHRILPFAAQHRSLFEKLNLTADDIRSTDDLVKLPFSSKKDLSNPRGFVIIPDQAILKKQWSTYKKILTMGPKRGKLALEEELRPIHMTSTTGRSSEPVPFLYTKHDLFNLELAGKRLMELCESSPDFRTVNAFPFAPHLAFWQAWYAALGQNSFMLSTGGGKVMGTDGNIRVISKINPDSLIAMPTFLYHLLQQARTQGLKFTNLQRLVLGGEKVPLGMRRKLTELCHELGSKHVKIVSTYGFTEAKMAFSECATNEGEAPSGYHLYPDLAFIEVIDPETGERVPDETPGEIVFTPLNARGSVVLRYRTGDMIEGGITYKPCPLCGRTCPRLLGKITRVSDRHHLNMDKLKGTLVDFSLLEHLLDDTDGLGAWQIELRKFNDDPLERDEIIVHATALKAGDSTFIEELIRKRMVEKTEISPNEIYFHSWETIREMQGVGVELKEKKLVDNRPTTSEPQ